MRKYSNIAACLLLSASSFLAVNCSVKEDREPCPSYLMVSFMDKGHIDSEVSLLGWYEEELFRDRIDVTDYDPYWVKAVRKGTVYFSAYRCKGSDARVSAHYVQSPAGSQADSLYAYHTEVVAEGETEYVDVSFKKQFCTVYLDIRRSAQEMRSFSFGVSGNTSGFDVLTFEPVPGVFDFRTAAASGERIVPFRIYRQMDDSMTVTVFRDGEVVGVFPLGMYIAKTGYSWESEDLQDIYIIIDLVMGQVTIAVEGWRDGAVFSFIEQ